MKFTNRHNIVLPDTPQWEKTDDGFLRCRALVLSSRIMPYDQSELTEIPEDFQENPVMMYVSRDTLIDPEAIRSLEGALVVSGDHSWMDPETVKEYAVGHVAGTPQIVEQEGSTYLKCDLLITDADAIRQIENKELEEVSAAYLAETLFEGGQDESGQPYHAEQRQLRYNHVAVIPAGHGRAGRDVRIFNQKHDGGKSMAETNVKVLRKVKLANSGKFVNVDEELAETLETENQAGGAKLEETMNQLEEKNGELQALQAEVEELKGELSVYKDKLDQLLSSDEMIEAAAEEMVEEQGEAGEILENAAIVNEKGEEDASALVEVKNSIKKLRGVKLHEKVLNSVGIKTEGMSPEGMKGAFKAQFQICNSMKGKSKVAGTKMTNSFNPHETSGAGDQVQRTAHQRLGFAKK